MIQASTLASLVDVLQNNSTKSSAKIIKLLNIEVLKSLGNDRYLLLVKDKPLEALSYKKLTPGEDYFARFEVTKDAKPTLSHLVKLPKIALQNFPLYLEPKELTKLLADKESLTGFKETLLKELANAPTKEHFQTLSPLLLSLYQHVVTIPLRFYDTFALLQFKKRYNKKTKKSFLDFYAFFPHLGALSGVISEQEIRMNVAFEETKEHLMNHADELGYKLNIEVSTQIKALFEAKTQRVLDIVT